MEADSVVSPDSHSPCEVHVENLGGITSSELSLPPGVSLLVGRNATNRSSFLRALAAALGAREMTPALKTDADEGSVALSFDGTECDRSVKRTGSMVQFDGASVTEDASLVDAFVTLFPDSPARRAVSRGEDLREVLMEPVDTDAIRERIDELRTHQDHLTSTIDGIRDEERNLPDLETQKTTLEEELTALEEEISDLRTVVADLEGERTNEDESAEATQYRDELEQLRSELATAERKHDEIESKISYRENECEDLKEKLDTLRDEASGGEEVETVAERIRELDRQIDRVKAKQDRFERTAEDLQSVIQVNETFLSEDVGTFRSDDDTNPSAALDPSSQTVECWTCGTDIEQSRVSARLDSLRELAAEHRAQARELDGELSSLRAEKSSHETTVETRARTRERIGELEDRIAGHERNVEELNEQLDAQTEDIERIEAEIETVETALQSLDTDDEDETAAFIERHQELSSLERKRGRLESQISQVTAEIDRIESLSEERVDAEAEREEVREELADLRGRIDQIEAELVETMNDVMEEVIGLLEYQNIARVWVERKEETPAGQSTFELHVVREADDGAVYEDSIDTLSESEREVIGLVVALVGYIVHDVTDTVPFLLLDSVEMIDGDRLARLLEYVQEETGVTYLAAALLPKDAQAVEESEALSTCSRIPFGNSTP